MVRKMRSFKQLGILSCSYQSHIERVSRPYLSYPVKFIEDTDSAKVSFVRIIFAVMTFLLLNTL